MAAANNVKSNVPQEEKADIRAARTKQNNLIESYIMAMGLNPERLYELNGKSDEQLKLMVSSISQRE